MTTVQILLNIAFGAGVTLGGIILKVIFDKMTKLQESDDVIRKDIKDLSISLPTNYVHKQDFKDLADAIFVKLDKISDKLDHKADKSEKD